MPSRNWPDDHRRPQREIYESTSQDWFVVTTKAKAPDPYPDASGGGVVLPCVYSLTTKYSFDDAELTQRDSTRYDLIYVPTWVPEGTTIRAVRMNNQLFGVGAKLNLLSEFLPAETAHWPSIHEPIYERFMNNLAVNQISHIQQDYPWDGALLAKSHVVMTGFRTVGAWDNPLLDTSTIAAIASWFASGGRVLVVGLEYHSSTIGIQVPTAVFSASNDLLSAIGSGMSVTPRDYTSLVSGYVTPNQSVAITNGIDKFYTSAFSPISGGTVIAELVGSGADFDGAFVAAEVIERSAVFVVSDGQVAIGELSGAYPDPDPNYVGAAEFWRRIAKTDPAGMLN